MKNLTYVIVTVVAMSLIGLLFLGCTGHVDNIRTEIFKALLQLLVIGITGHVISILITKANSERQELLALNEFRQGLLSRLNQAFVEVKSVRRLMRATSASETSDKGTKAYRIRMDDYHSYMHAINEAQLELEIISKDIGSNASLFTSHKQVIQRINSMEEYLNCIIDEYEHKTPKFECTPPTCTTYEVPMLSDLIGEYKRSKFRTLFVHTYYESLEMIRQDLLRLGRRTQA